MAKSECSALRLTSAAGQDLFPRVSPDGEWIAYTEANKTGTDIWVIPAGVAGRGSGHPQRHDDDGGGYVTVPVSAPYTIDRVWLVENHGVDPDIEVENRPAELLAAHDAQLETAVAVLLEQIKGKSSDFPAPPPLLPAYPPSRIPASRP